MSSKIRPFFQILFLILTVVFVLFFPLFLGFPPTSAKDVSGKQDINGDGTFFEISKGPGENWLTYHGDYRATRHSPLSQINAKNVKELSPRWIYNVRGADQLRTTPIVFGGRIYFVANNILYSLDASSGKSLWRWEDYPEKDLTLNRGVALWGDNIYFVSYDCRLVAINAQTGKLVWIRQYAPDGLGYYSTGAPLALKDKIILGVAGGHNGTRGFLAAFSPSDGVELWRFWTVPLPGERAYETWGGFDTRRGGAATWLTGSYDQGLNLLYWPTGNPWPNFDASDRPGDNLYSNSVLAINPDNGKLVWHFQFTPNDAHDWDSAEPLILVDEYWGSLTLGSHWIEKPRKLLMQANRNGFFYVLDRETGEFLLGKPFVRKLNWAKGLDARGRPIRNPGMESPVTSGEGMCPWIRGATNWMSSSYNPKTKLFYVVAVEQCGSDRGQYFLKAINPYSSDIVWEHAMTGPVNMAAGTLSTAGGLVFAGDDSGHLIALDAGNGDLLWRFQTGRALFASPMTFAVSDRQYVAIAAGSGIFVFSMFD
ncbi:MAG: PQQ-binding-like beta-propeller repeat protein [Candidatus Yanofskybacteria bacterium]|nr:PQQ-binding-like beta-propeller repeat protein [Candidatus Yanofskybacteria bacterium]